MDSSTTSTNTSRKNSTDQGNMSHNAVNMTSNTSSTSTSRDSSTCRAPTQHQRPAIDPLRQSYPKPPQDIDVASALAKGDTNPGRWSFKGQMKHQAQQNEARDEKLARRQLERNKSDFEATKKDLLSSFK